MRLFEITPQRTQGPEPVLMAILSFLKGKGDHRAGGVRVPMASVEALMQNAGQPITYIEIQNLMQKNQTIQNLIQSITQDELVINTHQPGEEDGEGGPILPGDEQDVEAMAKRAASRSE